MRNIRPSLFTEITPKWETEKKRQMDVREETLRKGKDRAKDSKIERDSETGRKYKETDGCRDRKAELQRLRQNEGEETEKRKESNRWMVRGEEGKKGTKDEEGQRDREKKTAK